MQEGFITFLFFLHLAIPLRRHLSPHPSTQSSLGGKRERGMGWRRRRRGERHYAYENVLKEVWFMYALDADSITGQWLKWDLSRNTEATWWNSVSLLAIRASRETTDRGSGKKGEKKESKRQIEEAYLQPGHTHLTHRERVNCNLPSKKDGSGSQTGVHLKDEWERKRGGIDGKESVNVCLWITVVNCEHWWGVCVCVYVCGHPVSLWWCVINQINYILQPYNDNDFCFSKSNPSLNDLIELS